jgi:peroxiredoxin
VAQLVELQRHLAALRGQGATVLAASLDPIATSEALMRRLRLDFPILQDSGHGLGSAFGDYQNAGTRSQDGDAIVILDALGHMRWRRYASGLITPATDVVAALARV